MSGMNTSYPDQGYRGRDGRGPDGPVHQEEQYQFSHWLVMNSAAQINLTLLHNNRKRGLFVHPKHRVEHKHWPHSKKEVCAKPSHKPKKNKGKGKGRTGSSDLESDIDNACGKTRTGCGGVQNYNKVDKDLLFDTVEEVLPTGKKGWKLVEAVYNAKTMSVGRPEQAAGSLKTKYQPYTKQKKPTGAGECPPEVKWAHEIKDFINTKAAHLFAALAPPLLMLSAKLYSLDPATSQVRDEAWAHHSFERTWLMMLSAQVDGLCSQLSAVLQENHDLKHKRDRAIMERPWAARLDKVTHRRSHDCLYGRSHSPSHHCWGRTTFAERDGIQHVGGKVHVEHLFSDGGVATVPQGFLSPPTQPLTPLSPAML
ncbi:hypothetical protein B0H19DRAFT_1073514 [Mycena capillaripes]|nr:hypothetical protein B0H19DRAFT_1073514 [Mycena capillaripes]